MNECKYKLSVNGRLFSENGTTLRVETLTPADRCSLKPKKDMYGQPYDILKWCASGGSPIDVAYPCSENCPLRVPAEIGNYGRSFTAPCPFCLTVNKRNSPGKVVCRECGEEFDMIDIS